MTADALLKYWQGHRGLTRRVIAAFPEKELFEFTIGGMRSFGAMAQELLAIAVPGIREMVEGQEEPLNETVASDQSKASLLQLWDEHTEALDAWWEKLPKHDFQTKIKSFGAYEGTMQSAIMYFIANEIHHRGQGYVYLRALGITPPNFWEH